MFYAIFLIVVLWLGFRAFVQARQRVQDYQNDRKPPTTPDFEVAKKLFSARNNVVANNISPNIAGSQIPDLPAPEVGDEPNHEIQVERAPRPPWLKD
jgi:hypothetical protein